MEATRSMMYKRKMNSSIRANFSNDQLRPSPGTCWGPRSIPDTELILIHAGSLVSIITPSSPSRSTKLTVTRSSRDVGTFFPT